MCLVDEQVTGWPQQPGQSRAQAVRSGIQISALAGVDEIGARAGQWHPGNRTDDVPAGDAKIACPTLRAANVDFTEVDAHHPPSPALDEARVVQCVSALQVDDPRASKSGCPAEAHALCR